MPRAYSMDLRERGIAACEVGKRTRSEIAEHFQISEDTLYDWLRRSRAQHSVAPAAHCGGRASELDAALLKSLVKAQNDRTLPQYAELYAEQTGRRYSPSHLSRVLKELGPPHAPGGDQLQWAECPDDDSGVHQ